MDDEARFIRGADFITPVPWRRTGAGTEEGSPKIEDPNSGIKVIRRPPPAPIPPLLFTAPRIRGDETTYLK